MANEQIVAIKITTDAAGANETVKGYKQQLREATAELVNMSMKFGETSKEAAEAAKKVAKLKDSIGDAKALADTFNPDKKFVALGGSLQGAVGGFSALQGAMGLFGGESKQVEQALLKVQSAMALQQGISTVFGSVDSFKLLYAQILKTSIGQRGYAVATTLATAAQKMFGVAVVTTSTAFKALRGAIIATGIGALVVAVGFLVEKIMDWANSASAAEKAQKKLADATDKTNAAIGNQIRILQARGGQEATIYNLKQKQTDNELETLRAKFKLQNGLNDEDMKKFQELKTNKQVLDIEEANRIKKIADDKAKADEDANKKEQKAGEQSVKLNKKNNDTKQKANEDAAQKLKDFNDAKLAEQNATDDLIQESRIAAIKDEYQKKALIIDTALDKETTKNIALKEKGLLTDEQFALREKLSKEKAEAEKAIAKDTIDKAAAAKELTNTKALNDAKLLEAERVNKILPTDNPEQAALKIDVLAAAKLTAETNAFNLAKLNKELTNGELAVLEQQHQDKITGITDEASKAKLSIEEKEKAGKLALLKSYQQAATDVANLLGQDTVAAKAIGVANALINTYQGIAAGVKLGYPLAIPAVISAAAIGFGAVKNIIATKIPGKGSGGSLPAGANVAAAVAPLTAQAATTTLDQQSINSIGQASSRAFVLETDVTNNQERIARLNRAARIN
jgi:hypothetical protein